MEKKLSGKVNTMKNIIRHGDVSLHPIEKAEGEVITHNGSFTVAFGEATGHHHKLTVERPQDLEIRRSPDGRMYFVLHKEGTLTHEEHLPIIVPIGVYEQKQEREYNWFSLAVQRVID